jgi:hypothetical protein
MSIAREAQSIPTGFIVKEFAKLPPKERPFVASKIAKLERKVFPAIEHFSYDVELKKKNIGVILAMTLPRWLHISCTSG